QKIVIKVQMTCDKCRTKAIKIAAKSSGTVISVGIEGEDQLVVIGEGVDSACLTRSLRKKLCYATILTVEEVKPPEEEKPKPEEEKKPKPPEPTACHCLCPPPPPRPMYCEVVYHDQNPNSCLTM
ncbi:hypothetical protein F2P56_013395, partial [Juglans regia]